MKFQEIYKSFQENETRLDRYFEEQFQKTAPLIYLSTDLRHSGFKIAPVDTNLFPAGFNNLCNSFTHLASEAFSLYLERYAPQTKKILLYVEAHTRNRFYFENVLRLSAIITHAGYEVKVATLSQDFQQDPSPIILDGKGELLIYQLHQKNHLCLLNDSWTPDLILSNNDFSSEIPEALMNIQQKIIPSPNLGWHQRKKSTHFQHYEAVAKEVAELIGIDPWFISTAFTHVTDINLQETSSLERLAKSVDEILSKIQKKYTEYNITQTPYVFVKNDSGTYGMGMAYFTSGEELLNLNRRMRFKLSSTKGGGNVDRYLIQEGIVTADFYSGYPIEPVIYMAGEQEIGGFFRINEEKDEWSSLNTKGMAFSCLCLHKMDEPHEGPFLNCVEKAHLVKMSFKIAKIAALAAAREATQN